MRMVWTCVQEYIDFRICYDLMPILSELLPPKAIAHVSSRPRVVFSEKLQAGLNSWPPHRR